MRLALLIGGLAAALGAACPSAFAAVPREFIGVNAQVPIMEESQQVEREHAAMAETGVGSVRVLFDWRSAQPYRRMSDVPVAERERFREERGVPTDWSQIDRFVGAAAQARIRVLPIVMMAPEWAAYFHWQYPNDSRAYARFAGTLAGRYGPGGRFWSENPGLPRVPIRDWQLWNEPDYRDYWAYRPFQPTYLKFVRLARKAIKRVDRRARIVLAGFANRSWRTLRSVYRRGGRRLFDVVAIHPFTARVGGIVEIVRRARRVMRRHGDARKPIMVTEFGWTSGPEGWQHRSFLVAGEQGQAERVAAAYRRFAARRRALRVERVYWFTWLSSDRDHGDVFNWSGLSRLREDGTIERKPSYFSFQQVARELRE